jgi:nucleotide-binding universal stress UspA family protein
MKEIFIMDDNAKVIKNILVTTDFSSKSDFAISRAIDIAKKFNANITVLHVCQKTELDNFLDKNLKKILPK